MHSAVNFGINLHLMNARLFYFNFYCFYDDSIALLFVIFLETFRSIYVGPFVSRITKYSWNYYMKYNKKYNEVVKNVIKSDRRTNVLQSARKA